MIITITGASGFIGRRLMKVLTAAGHELKVLSRHAGTNLPAGATLFPWDPLQGPPPEKSLRCSDAIIHLAGEPVAQRWSAAVKQRISDSRVIGTRNLVAGLARLDRRPDALISASAVGYYGSRGDTVLTEDAPPADSWLARLCVAWEREAAAAAELGMRVAHVRIGLVLDPAGGALRKMLPAFRMGIAGRLGSGRQWMPWIHLADLTALLAFAAENPIHGPVNAAAPYPVTNAEFTRELATVLHRPAIFPVPAFALKLLFGEMAEVTLASQRVVPAAAEAAGFLFRHPQLEPALVDLFP